MYATLDAKDAEEYYTLITSVSAPVAAGLAKGDVAARERIRAATVERLRAMQDADGAHIPSHRRCIAAVK